MLWSVAAITWPRRYVDRLTPFDLEVRHRRFRDDIGCTLASALPSDEILGAEIRQGNLEMAKVIQRSLVASMSLALTAVLFAMIIASAARSEALLPQGASARLGISSILILVAATLGRVGWPPRSREDLTTLGMADRLIYWLLYGVGGLLGVLAFWPWESTTT